MWPFACYDKRRGEKGENKKTSSMLRSHETTPLPFMNSPTSSTVPPLHRERAR